MRKINFIVIIAFFCLSCKDAKDFELKSDAKEKHYIDSLYVIDENFKVGDVRRYGVMPGISIGQHPKLLKDKLEVLLDISESGVELFFPKGVYNRTFNIEQRSSVRMFSDSAIFTGAINIKNSNNVTINGVIQSLSRFYTQNSNNIDVNTIITKTDSVLKKNSQRSTGCAIHGGSYNVFINKVIINDSGSGSELYKYVKGALIVHGHNNEPSNIKIDSVIVQSSDRHGAYLTGTGVEIKYLEVKDFGIGSSSNMAPMEGGIEGEQKNFAGLWVKNCHDCFIDEAVIDIKNSKGKYSVNFDIGEDFRPTSIGQLTIKNSSSNKNITKRIFSRTGVIYEKLIEK